MLAEHNKNANVLIISPSRHAATSHWPYSDVGFIDDPSPKLRLLTFANELMAASLDGTDRPI